MGQRDRLIYVQISSNFHLKLNPTTQSMSDTRRLWRNIEIHLPDESTIDLEIDIAMSTKSNGCIANDRINLETLAKVLETIQFMLIATLEKTREEMEEMVWKDGK